MMLFLQTMWKKTHKALDKLSSAKLLVNLGRNFYIKSDFDKALMTFYGALQRRMRVEPGRRDNHDLELHAANAAISLNNLAATLYALGRYSGDGDGAEMGWDEGWGWGWSF